MAVFGRNEHTVLCALVVPLRTCIIFRFLHEIQEILLAILLHTCVYVCMYAYVCTRYYVPLLPPSAFLSSSAFCMRSRRYCLRFCCIYVCMYVCMYVWRYCLQFCCMYVCMRVCMRAYSCMVEIFMHLSAVTLHTHLCHFVVYVSRHA